MDDGRLGMTVRAARLKRVLRQRDLARLVGVSDSVISRLERGHVDGISVGTLRAVARALDIRIELVPRSRSGNLDRLVGQKHANLAEAVIRWLGVIGGAGAWVIRPEVSFAFYADRGVIDLLAWHPATRSLLVIELKTAIVNVGEILGVLDMKARNAARVAERFGWEPLAVSSLLIVAEGSTNRRRVDAHAATFLAALPHRLVHVRRWLVRPAGRLAGLVFFSDQRGGQVLQRFAHAERMRVPTRRPHATRSRSAERVAGPPSAGAEARPTLLTPRTALLPPEST
jgi:transcriptional regulator with XRE-family HTH domain